MTASTVKCPACGEKFSLPAGWSEEVVQCSHCHKSLRLRLRPSVEEEIAGWLGGDDDAGPPPGLEEPPQPEAPGAPPDAEAKGPEDETALHVLDVTAEGVLLEFPTSRLLEPGFRGAMPRECLWCGAREHLRCCVIVFAVGPGMPMRDADVCPPPVLIGEDLSDLDADKLLKRLRRVPNVPHPGDLPMPYWLCELCTGGIAVAGRFELHAHAASGRAGLIIRNAQAAERFLAAADGEGCAGHLLLRERIRRIPEDPFRALPFAVQRRLSVWFRPEAGEKFVAYVPDRNTTWQNDGMAGLVVSDRRLIYHTRLVHRDAPISEPLRVKLSVTGPRGEVDIKSTALRLKHFHVDADGARVLRLALTKARFQVWWR